MRIGSLGGGQEPLIPEGSPKGVEERAPSPTSITREPTILGRTARAASAAWKKINHGDSNKTPENKSRYSAVPSKTASLEAEKTDELAISQIHPESKSIEVDLEEIRLETKRAELKTPLLKNEIAPSGFSRKREIGAMTRMTLEEGRSQVKNDSSTKYEPPEYIPPKKQH